MPVRDAKGTFPAIAKAQRHRSRGTYESARLGYCELCGAVATAGRTITPHHVKSRGAGGGDDRGNLVSVCPECHRGIHDGSIKRSAVSRALARRGDVVV